MCTSFMYRGKDILIAMNYDNYGNNLQIAPYNKKLFLVTGALEGQTRPLFGIRSDGVFVNQQFMPPCEGGEFKKGESFISTVDFVEKVLLEKLDVNDMEHYLMEHEVVSPPSSMLRTTGVKMPDFHIHTMLASVCGDSYIIEPGRRNLKFDKDKKYIVMSNCSLYKTYQNGQYVGFGADRQRRVEQLLEIADDNFQVMDAFEVLKEVQLYQYGGFCSTEFSFVYSQKDHAVYYCYNREFHKIHKYQMEELNNE